MEHSLATPRPSTVVLPSCPRGSEDKVHVGEGRLTKLTLEMLARAAIRVLRQSSRPFHCLVPGSLLFIYCLRLQMGDR